MNAYAALEVESSPDPVLQVASDRWDEPVDNRGAEQAGWVAPQYFVKYTNQNSRKGENSWQMVPVQLMNPDRNPEVQQVAKTLGRHLKTGRRRHFPRDSQEDFARRIGVSRATYSKMEHGDLGVALGSYLEAARLLGRVRVVAESFEPRPESIFDRATR